MSIKAFIYLRHFDGEDNSLPLDEQLAMCQQLAQNEKVEIVDIYKESNMPGCLYPTGLEELSSVDIAYCDYLQKHNIKAAFRPELGKLLKNLKKVNYIIVDRLETFVDERTLGFLGTHICHQLAKANVKLITVNTYVGYSKYQQENTQKSKDAIAKIKDSGIFPTEPKMFGIKYLGGKDKVVEVDQDCAQVIKYIYNEILNGTSQTTIVKYVNENYSHLFKKALYLSTFRSIASQPFYCGYMYNTKDELIVAKQMQGKEIISLDTWKAVQDIMAQKERPAPRKQFRKLPFSQLVCCSNCNAYMVSGNDKGKTFYYCHRGTNLKPDDKCKDSRVIINTVRQSENYTGLGLMVAPFLVLPLVKYLEDKRKSDKKALELAELEEELQKETKKQSLLFDTFQDIFTAKELKETMRDVDKKVNKLQRKVDDLKLDMQFLASMDEFTDTYSVDVDDIFENNLDEDVFEKLLHLAIKKISPSANNVLIETVYGKIVIDRYIEKNFRNFPKFTWRKISKKPNETNLKKCEFEVTFIYDKNNETTLIAKLGNVSFFKK